MADAMGRDKIRYLIFINGRWRWRPTKAMRDLGFCLTTLTGTDPAQASIEDQRRAIALNRRWDAVRYGQAEPPATAKRELYPKGSVGEAYLRAMAMRLAERKAKGLTWTKEQESRDDWPRAWKWLGPEFADCDPRTIQPEHFLRISGADVSGLVPRIERTVSVTERHRVVKVWRALWGKMRAMGYVSGDDPSLSFANSAPDPRGATWQRREVLCRVQRAWRMGYHGLAACMAVAWDSMLSPIDARRLTPSQARNDAHGVWFELGRAKTGRPAAATLSPWSAALLRAYLARLGVDLHQHAPIFRNRSGSPYSKDTLGDDFRAIREAFNPADKRQLADMRRSGAVEGDAGGGSLADQANKMANSVDTNKRLRKTYNPTNVASVRRFDGARALGAALLEQNRTKSVTAPDLVTLLENRRYAKSLK